jgi:hypothetical protein
MASDLWKKSAEEVAKDQLEDYLLSKYGPRPDGDDFHDRFVKAGSSVGKFLGGAAGARIGGAPGGFAGAEAGSLGGAWVANGAYRQGQLIKNILTHPENWTVDAAGAIVPVLPDPASASNATEPNEASASSSIPPLQNGAATIGPSTGEPRTRFLGSRKLNSFGEPISPWQFSVRIGEDPSGTGSPSVSPNNAGANPPTFQTGVGTIGPSLGRPPGSVFAAPPWQNPFGNGVGNWPSSAAPAGPLYTAQAASQYDQPGGLPGMLLEYLRSNPRSTQASPTPAAASSQASNAPQASSPLQPDETQDVADNGPTRFLGRRTYSLSDPSPFPQRASLAAAQASPDGSLSLNDAYLEYLKRLNGGQSLT